MWKACVQSLGWEDPLEKGMATHLSILAGEFHGQRSLVDYSLWGHKELDYVAIISISTLSICSYS